MGNNKWAIEEEQFLIDNYADHNIYFFMEKLNRTKASIVNRIVKLNLSKTYKWTEDKINLLKELYPTEEMDELLKIFYPTTKQSLHNIASENKIERTIYGWSDSQKEFLINYYNDYSNEELSKLLDKSISQITTQAYRMKLTTNERWTEEDLEYLVKNYAHVPTYILAKRVNRKEHNIVTKALQLGLKKENLKNYGIDEFVSNFKKYANELGRTPLIIEVASQPWSMSAVSINRYFGGYRKLCEQCGLEGNICIFGISSSTYLSKNGDICLSIGEKIITDFFIDNNIWYKKEAPYSKYMNDDSILKVCDWVLEDNTFVEFFGFMGVKVYEEKTAYKIELCKERNIKLIEIYEKDIPNLAKIFIEYMKTE